MTKIVWNISNIFHSMEVFFVKSRKTEILRGHRFDGTAIKLKTGSMAFNETWYQLFSDTFNFKMQCHSNMNSSELLEKYYNENWSVLRVIQQSIPHWLIYIFSSVLATALFICPQKFFCWVRTISEHMRSYGYHKTALPLSPF